MRAIKSFSGLMTGMMCNAMAGAVVGDRKTLDESYDNVDPNGPLTSKFKEDGYSVVFCDDPPRGRFGVSVYKNGQANMMVVSSAKFPEATAVEHSSVAQFAAALRDALRADHLVLECHDVKGRKVGFLVMESEPAWHLVGQHVLMAQRADVEDEIRKDAS